MPRKLNTLTFIEKAKLIHGDNIDYSEVIYKHSKEKIILKCNKCGTKFKQEPNNHLQGRGCLKCALSSNTDEFIKKAKLIHNEDFDYSKTKYKKASEKVSIKCKKCGNVFKQTPTRHLQGYGCRNCANNYNGLEKYENNETILYYVKIDGYYKVGLTQKSINHRFREDNINIDIINFWKFSNGAIAYKIEQEILIKYSDFRYDYKSRGKILKSGNSELLTIDINNDLDALVKGNKCFPIC